MMDQSCFDLTEGEHKENSELFVLLLLVKLLNAK